MQSERNAVSAALGKNYPYQSSAFKTENFVEISFQNNYGADNVIIQSFSVYYMRQANVLFIISFIYLMYHQCNTSMNPVKKSLIALFVNKIKASKSSTFPTLVIKRLSEITFLEQK